MLPTTPLPEDTQGQAIDLRAASTWALLVHPFHDSTLDVPYGEAVETELRRRGFVAPIRALADAFLRVLLLPLRMDFTAWPDPSPPGVTDVFFCLSAWFAGLGLAVSIVLAGSAVVAWSWPPLAASAIVLAVGILPFLLLLVLSGALRRKPRQRRAA